MSRFRVVPLVAVVIIALLAPTASWAGDKDTGLSLVNHLPKDALIVWAAESGNCAEMWDQMLTTLRKIVPEKDRPEMEKGLAELDEKLGLSLRDDLLAHIGPEFALSIDIPPIDMAAGAVMSGAPDSMATVLGKIGLWVQVTDAKRVDQSIRTLVAKAELELTEQDGVASIGKPRPEEGQESGPQEPDVRVFYTVHGGTMAIGFSADAVRAMLEPLAPEARITAGADFKAVFANLDRGYTSMGYVNLPRLQEMLKSSQMVQGALAGNAEAAPVAALLFDPEVAPSGIGVTSTRVGNGVRQVTYAPGWMSNGAASAGVIAAIAIPNMLGAIDRGRCKRTMADMRTVATAVEAYGIDENSYPSTDGEWVEVSEIGEHIAPMYIRQVPATDGWSFPLLYSSDGSTYRLVSPGRDGQTSRDWRGEVESEMTYDFDDDIVYGDGVFLVYPSNVGGS